MRSSSIFVRCLLSALFSVLAHGGRDAPSFRDGGAEEDRTPDPLRARQVLSQLSYGPRLTRRQASPQDIRLTARREGKHLPANCVGCFVGETWWVWVDLNHRPHPYQGCALTN